MPRAGKQHTLATYAALLGLAIACKAVALASDSPQFDALLHQVEARPGDLLAGNSLRTFCRAQKSVDHCIEALDRVAADHPAADAIRINAALAYVDQLPGHSLYIQARLSTHSIEHVSAILAHDADNWLALYIRGLNNLYWPLWYRRTDRAIADLNRCIQLSEALPPPQRKPYMVLAYIALGDTYARLSQIDQARAIWTQGAARYASQLLQDRLQTQPGLLHERIESIRSREVPIDTDLKVFVSAQGASPL
jgi:hypothetical protein